MREVAIAVTFSGNLVVPLVLAALTRLPLAAVTAIGAVVVATEVAGFWATDGDVELTAGVLAWGAWATALWTAIWFGVAALGRRFLHRTVGRGRPPQNRVPEPETRKALAMLVLPRLPAWWVRRRSPRGWYELYVQAHADYWAGAIDVDLYWRRRVNAEHALISHGATAIPYAQQMLAMRDADVREDGAAILAAIGGDVGVVDGLLAALEPEREHQPRDAIIGALGELRDPRALPALAAVVRDQDADGDTRWDAAIALGHVVGRTFDREADPIVAAGAWLDQHTA